MRILHIEDEAWESELLERSLRDGGLDWEVRRVETREAMVAALEDEDLALIVSDNALPSFNGLEALRAAQTRRPDVPFVFHSGTLGDERAVEVVKAGASEVVIKGTPGTLVPALLRALREAKEREGRRRAERQLRESEERYRRLFHSNPLPTWILDPKTLQFLDVNDAAVAHYGYTREEFLTMTALDIRPEEDAEAYKKAPAAAGLTKAGQWRHRKKEGTVIWVDVAAHDMTFEGRPVRLVAVSDVTGIVEAKQTLMTQSLQQMALIRLSHFAFVTAAPEDVMRAAAECVSLSLNVEYGAVWELLPDGDALLLRAGIGWKQGRIGSTTVSVANGSWAGSVLESTDPLRTEDLQSDCGFQPEPVLVEHGVAGAAGVIVAGPRQPFGMFAVYTTRRRAFTDVEARFLEATAGILATAIEKDRAEGALKRQRLALYQTEKVAAMGSLLAGVAHELNNPLSVVIGQVSLLRRTADSATQQRADKIALAAERCARIVKNFLALARDRPPERERVALTQVINEALELVVYPLRVDGIDVVTSLAADLPTLWADPHQLHQVVVNLITNAHHALKGRQVPRQIRVSTRRGQGSGAVILEIEDTGPGMPPEIRARVFEPFFTTKPAGQGTGLGLSLCLGIVQSHGGRIELDSRPGHGTRFTIELPAGKPVPTQAQPEVVGRPTRRGPGKHILVVDDEEVLLDVLAEMLTGMGHTAERFSDARLALRRMGEIRCDLVISDLKMPELDGLSFFRLAEQQFPGSGKRFVFITGDTLSQGTAEFLETSGRPFLVKPFSVEDCERVIDAALTGAAATPGGDEAS